MTRRTLTDEEIASKHAAAVAQGGAFQKRKAALDAIRAEHAEALSREEMGHVRAFMEKVKDLTDDQLYQELLKVNEQRDLVRSFGGGSSELIENRLWVVTKEMRKRATVEKRAADVRTRQWAEEAREKEAARRNPDEDEEQPWEWMEAINQEPGLDVSGYIQHAKTLSDDQLEAARIQAHKDLERATEMGGGTKENDFRAHRAAVQAIDQIHILGREMQKRNARQNPEWAKTIGAGLYKGARFTAEVGQDIYRGARAAHKTRRGNPSLREYGHELVAQYLKTALWSSVDDQGIALDRQYSINDFAPDAIEQAQQECMSFDEQADTDNLSNSDVGHYFWLTRNRHGHGFWALNLGEQGKALTKLAHSFGETEVYMGEDGKLHFT
jgi:hypothetical protein